MKNNKTGIALFVYNRPSHTKRVLEGLRQNNIDHLYIFADGTKGEEDTDDVGEVRNIIHSVDCCNTSIIEAEHNKGLADSIVDGVSYVLDRHERIIVLEDDCVPSSDFISFMDKCFDKYEDYERVMNVTGYSLPIEVPADYQYDIYFSYRSSSWGWGTWTRAWEHFERNNCILERIQNSDKLRKRVERAGTDLIPMLKKQIEGKIDSWSVYWSINIAKKNGVCINPVNAKVKNVGLDGTGTHSGKSTKYNVKIKKCTEGRINIPAKIIIDDRITNNYHEFFSPTYRDIAKRNIFHLCKNLGIYPYLKALKDKANRLLNEVF